MQSSILQNAVDQELHQGEEYLVYALENLQDYLNCNDFNLVFEPNGPNTFPDFGLLSNKFGVTYFEVKHLSIKNILSWDNKTITHNGYTSEVDTLYLSDKGVVFETINEFITNLQVDKRNIGVPVSMVWAFTNINSYEVEEKFGKDVLRQLNDTKNLNIIFKDDLKDGKHLDDALFKTRLFKPKFNERSKHLSTLYLNRTNVDDYYSFNEQENIELVPFNPSKYQIDDITPIDKIQYYLANDLVENKGVSLISGPAGSGKSVLLTIAAEKFAKANPDKKIFITYKTSSLKGQFSYLSETYPNIIEDDIFSFCMQEIIPFDEKVGYDNYISFIISELRKRPPLFDLVLVDEGQDFDDNYLQIFSLLTKGADLNAKKIIYLFDDDQNIFNKLNNQNTLLLNSFETINSSVKKLKTVYRTPHEIIYRAGNLVDKEIKSVRALKNSFNLIKIDCIEDIFANINHLIKKSLHQIDGLKLSDIAIIHPNLNRVDKDFSLSEYLDNSLKHSYQRHYKESPISKDDDSVKVLSINYAKGLDFSLTFLILFDLMDEEYPNKEETLYVALSRTKKFTFLFYTKETILIEKLQVEIPEFEEI